MQRAIVLLSGGLDSAVNLKCALDRGQVVAAITFDYGQRAARRERAAAAAMCRRFRITHEVIRLPWLGRITRTALVRRSARLPHPREANLDGPGAASTAARVWVPNRNGVFVAIAAAFAEARAADCIVPGFNAEEAATFPDNSIAFVRAMNAALEVSTRRRIRVRSFTGRYAKRSILSLGMRIGAPLDLVWCCYEGGKRMCGRCESCLRFVRAVRALDATAWFQERHARLPPQLQAVGEAQCSH